LRVLFSYSPDQEDELQLEPGDEIEFISEVEDGWWKGKLRGTVGIFPSNFVEPAENKTNGTATNNGKPKNRESANIGSRSGIFILSKIRSWHVFTLKHV